MFGILIWIERAGSFIFQDDGNQAFVSARWALSAMASTKFCNIAQGQDILPGSSDSGLVQGCLPSLSWLFCPQLKNYAALWQL
jgi:hypothetical protein